MAKFELKLPKMGESVAEATITAWLKEVGDTIELDEAVLEIATDKVDSEVPSEVDGILIEKRELKNRKSPHPTVTQFPPSDCRRGLFPLCYSRVAA